MSGATDASLRCQIMGGRLCVLHSGKIFDLTDFAEKHPGGKEVLEKHVGKDVTQVMRSEDVHKHSQAAYNIMDRYYIGEYNGVNGVVSIFFCEYIPKNVRNALAENRTCNCACSF